MKNVTVTSVRLRNGKGSMYAAYLKGQRGAIARDRTEEGLMNKLAALDAVVNFKVPGWVEAAESTAESIVDIDFPEFGVDIERELAIEYSDELENA